MILVYTKTAKEVCVGDLVVTTKMKRGTVVGISNPHHVGSYGRVYVIHEGEPFSTAYDPKVIGAEWVADAKEAEEVCS